MDASDPCDWATKPVVSIFEGARKLRPPPAPHSITPAATVGNAALEALFTALFEEKPKLAGRVMENAAGAYMLALAEDRDSEDTMLKRSALYWLQGCRRNAMERSG